MSLSKIISIPGMSGLFKMVAQLRNGGYVVESFMDQKRIPVSATQRIVMLQDISVYTTSGELPLNDVLLKMKEHNELCSQITAQSEPALLRSTLKKIMPEFDDDRVHDSDIRKMFNWYVLLKDQIEKEVLPEDNSNTTQEENAGGIVAAETKEELETADAEKKTKPKVKKAVKKKAE